jgi:hypothetical protein
MKIPSSRSGCGAECCSRQSIAARRRHAPGGPMDKIFETKLPKEIDLTIEFYFYLNFLSFNIAHSPLFMRCVEL